MQNKKITSALLESIPNVEYGFGDFHHSFPENFSYDLWIQVKPSWKQVHGNHISVFEMAKENLGDCDGIYSRKKQLPVGIVTADCVPILLARRDGTAISGLHAGWRGTFARIVDSWAKQVLKMNDDPKNWVAVLGPSISGENYEVSQELIDQFRVEFPKVDQLSPKNRHLDLKAINVWQLKNVGVPAIETIPLCTRTAKLPDGHYQFHSYRREGPGTRQYSVIMLR